MNELKLLHESVVDESEIDSLGHLNVRFYVARAATANFNLLGSLGITAQPGNSLKRTDTYNRFHREQFAGARLGVFGGLAAIEGQTGVSGYYEIRNLDDDHVAASFIINTNRIDQATESIIPMIELGNDSSTTAYVAIPTHGQPRSLKLVPPKQVTLDEMKLLIPEESIPGSMNGRREGIVLPEDCDESGRVKEDVDPMFIMFRPQPGEDLKNMGPPLQRDEQGRRYSFAMMEIRNINWHQPRLGDTILSMSADITFGDKWRHTRRWIFTKETGLLLGISDHAAVCMDLDARKAISIPAELRESMQRLSLPDYG
ncbi:MAG: acyl-CoA thioester hydrolase [Candidatus Azotimanducaceae bacterium]|jgi:acyl-CoA thioester hydrolase